MLTCYFVADRVGFLTHICAFFVCLLCCDLLLFDCRNNATQRKRFYMTQIQFQILCGKHLIEPNMALENQNIIEALRESDDEKVERILETEF